jgi:ABC-type lipoprotein export system ATPase subunit
VRIDVRGAQIRFGDRVVFTDFDATFRPARTTALVGPSGSGKSTLLAVLAGFRRLDEGSVTIEGLPGGHPRSGSVAWVPQAANALGSRTVLDNVVVGPLAFGVTLRSATESALTWLDRVGIAHLAASRAKELSGGELQRLALARALASGRPIVLADEPSANLDRQNTENIAEVFTRLRSAATIIIATHDPVLVASADDVVYMRPGEGS